MQRTLYALGVVLCFVFIFQAQASETAAPSDSTLPSSSEPWGNDIIDFSQLINTHSAKSLGLTNPAILSDVNNNSIFDEQQSWTSSPQNNSYHFASTQTDSIITSASTVNAIYSHGNFSAQTGITTYSNNLLESGQFYLQGSYNLYDGERFNLLVTAKVESLNTDAISSYYGQNDMLRNNTLFTDKQVKNTTFGLLTTYSVTKRWKILGFISSTSFDNRIKESPLIQQSNIHSALIGTSYSF